MQVFGSDINGHLQDTDCTVRCGNYHGWQIDVCQDGNLFTFQCYPPDLNNYLDAGEEYLDHISALQAARAFVDRENVIQALLDVMNEWFYQDLINEAEYWNLTNFE